MPRITPPAPADMTPRQREVHDAIASGPRGRVEGPLAVWLRRPELAQKAQELGAYCRYGTSLPPRLSELAILTMARVWTAEFEWWAHKGPALDGGLAPEIIEALRIGETPTFAAEDEAAVHAFALEAQTARRVSDATYARAVAALGEDGVVDLVGILGYYSLISLTLNIFEVMPPEGEALAFE
ncbi:MAG: 4-carboxymuconolactone decarboxylase [Rhodobacteraceae bacterium]|nr:4-carboxymuconolactone decarboxylase [Paracoccaceae bacterium]MBR27009.1 4-carboxymuconolactone decarboxylase [Paracoccaceae bacterium]